MISRRGFLGALAAIPILGRFVPAPVEPIGAAIPITATLPRSWIKCWTSSSVKMGEMVEIGPDGKVHAAIEDRTYAGVAMTSEKKDETVWIATSFH